MVGMVGSDWFWIGCIVISLFIGWQLGVFRVLTRLGAPVIAFIAARRFSAFGGVLLDQQFGISEKLAENDTISFLQQVLSSFYETPPSVSLWLVQTLAFFLIFFLLWKGIKLLAVVWDRSFGATVLGTLDRTLGAIIGFFIFALVAVFFYLHLLPAFLDNSDWQGWVWLWQQTQYSLWVWPALETLASGLIQTAQETYSQWALTK
ncbi:MAG: hypothetical protein HFI72_03635 [Peptococcaceae bacterium]|jgi:hypothetical protein|nr:hypothetical protein [Peptococcaceae bacterium]